MRVAVAENDHLFREGLVLLLQTAGIEVVCAVPDGDALLRDAGAADVDVVLLDIQMPPGRDGGLSTAARLRERSPAVGVLFLTAFEDTEHVRAALDIATERIGYRLKSAITDLDALVDSLTRVRNGDLVLEPRLARQLYAPGPGHRDRLATLSARESEVLALMAEGASNSRIAAGLWISTKAVEKNVASIFAKLGLPFQRDEHHRRVLAVLEYLKASSP